MRALLCPASLKGVLSARAAAGALGRGFREAGADVTELPVADGGEGTYDALSSALGGEFREAVVSDPLGRPVPARWLRLPDYGVLHTFLALLYALLSALLGVALSIVPRSDGSLRAAAVYGVLGLVGFLGQMVLGMQARILPMFAACHANRSATCEAPPVTPGEMGDPGLQAGVFVLWAAGVPLLAAGMGARVAAVAGTGGLLLFAASLIQAAGTARVLRRAFSARCASPGARPLPARPALRAAHRWPRPPAGTA